MASFDWSSLAKVAPLPEVAALDTMVSSENRVGIEPVTTTDAVPAYIRDVYASTGSRIASGNFIGIPTSTGGGGSAQPKQYWS